MNTIKAYAGDVLRVADRFFDASLHTIVSELAQNARRSGATTLRVNYVRDDSNNGFWITLEDNGTGLENPAVLLGLADTGWDSEIKAEEEPAGMGFFVLAACQRASAESHGWRIKLRPEAFKGEVEVPVEDLCHHSPGMKVGFYWPGSEADLQYALDHVYGKSLRDFFRHCGLDVTLNGIRLQRGDFLLRDSVKAGGECSRVFVDWPDLGAQVTFSVRPAAHAYTYPACMLGKFNFHGFQGSVVLSPLTSPQVEEVRINILHAGKLKLTLPTREKLQENQYLSELLSRIELASYEALRGRGHSLPYEVWKNAERRGVVLPAASPCLATIDGYNYREWGVSELEGAVILPAGFDSVEKAYVAQAAEFAGKLVLKGRAVFNGYPWYDALPKIEVIKYILDGVPLKHEAEEGDDRITFHSLPETGPIGLRLVLRYKVEGAPDLPAVEWPLLVLADPEDGKEWDPERIVWTLSDAASADDTAAIVEFMSETYMSTSECGEDYEEKWKMTVEQECTRRMGDLAGSIDYGLEAARYSFFDKLVLPRGIAMKDLEFTMLKPFGTSYPQSIEWRHRGTDTGPGDYEIVVRRTVVGETVVKVSDAASLADAMSKALEFAGTGDFVFQENGEPEISVYQAATK